MNTEIENFKEAWTEEVTKCCKARVVYKSTSLGHHKACSLCNSGNSFFPAPTVFLYHPSTLEEILLTRVEALENALKKAGIEIL